MQAVEVGEYMIVIRRNGVEVEAQVVVSSRIGEETMPVNALIIPALIVMLSAPVSPDQPLLSAC